MGKVYIVGLGNPGKKYEHTRHNVGFMTVDVMAKALNLEWKVDASLQAQVAVDANRGIVLMKPQTFMNKSGESVRALVRYGGQYEALYVVYDDLDLTLGKYKIVLDSAPKIHNGINSIKEALGADASYWHVRMGTDGRNGDRSMPGEEYVLTTISPEEKVIVQTMIESVVKELNAKIISS